MYIMIVDGYPRRATMRFDKIPMVRGIVNNSTDAANHTPRDFTEVFNIII